jgi:hypothetical protein
LSDAVARASSQRIGTVRLGPALADSGLAQAARGVVGR